jgi:hypothetical protein
MLTLPLEEIWTLAPMASHPRPSQWLTRWWHGIPPMGNSSLTTKDQLTRPPVWLQIQLLSITRIALSWTWRASNITVVLLSLSTLDKDLAKSQALNHPNVPTHISSTQTKQWPQLAKLKPISSDASTPTISLQKPWAHIWPPLQPVSIRFWPQHKTKSSVFGINAHWPPLVDKPVASQMRSAFNSMVLC